MRRIPLLAGLVLCLSGCAVPGLTLPTAAPQPPAPLLSMPPVPDSTVAPVQVEPLLMDGKGLNPRLAAAFERAQADAAKAGLTLRMNSGYRSPAEQERVFAAKVKQYGSRAEAHKWALYPWESMHVRGLAIDVGPAGAGPAWLQKNQERYGICRRYANEPWHFELKLEKGACLPLKPSATSEG